MIIGGGVNSVTVRPLGATHLSGLRGAGARTRLGEAGHRGLEVDLHLLGPSDDDLRLDPTLSKWVIDPRNVWKIPPVGTDGTREPIQFPRDGACDPLHS